MASDASRGGSLRPRGKTLAAGVALGLIGWYQRVLSPRKGFRCAHRSLYGGMSCSGYAAHVIERDGVLRGWTQTRVRFRECHEAAVELRSRRLLRAEGGPFTEGDPFSGNSADAPGGSVDLERKGKPKPPPSGRDSSCCDGADCSGCASCDLSACDLGGCDSSHCGSHGCDLSGCDVSACDASHCSSCDVSGCDSCSCDGCGWN